MTLPPLPQPFDIDRLRAALLQHAASHNEATEYAIDPADFAALGDRIHRGIIAEKAAHPARPTDPPATDVNMTWR